MQIGDTMKARFRSWWQKIRQRWVAIVVTTAIMVTIAVIIVCLWFNGAGFNGYTQVSTIRTLIGPTAGTVTRTETNQPGKTLWDLMQLLIIPVVLVIVGSWFNHRERKAAELRAEAEQEIEQQRAETERHIAQDNQREAALQEYIDKISELLLEKQLRDSKPEDEVRTIARVRTLTVLPRLDKVRKRSILQFLCESRLISIVDLSEVDLSGVKLDMLKLKGAKMHEANLSEADLTGADLSEADLLGANLSRACLVAANLRKTIFYEAILTGANLFRADLHHALLFDASMSKANLSETRLSEASLNGAYLIGTDMRKADLNKADLRYAILDDSILDEAIMTEAIYTAEQLDKAKSLKGATMPDGSIHP